MKVILVNGSPNQKGCTHQALQEVSSALNGDGVDSEFYWIGNKPIAGCLGCHKCENTGKCVINDQVNEFHKVAENADGFIFGTPVHYAAASGALACFMGRAFISDFAGNGNRAFYLKPAAAVVSARRAGTTATFDQINKYFTLHEMPVISSCYWNMVHGDEPSEVLKDEEGLRIMRVLAHNMAYFLKCKIAGEATGVPLPKREEFVFTNFIR